MKRLADMALICDDPLWVNGNLTIEYDSIEFLMEIAPQRDEVVWVCRYPFYNGTCSDLFTPILTEEGICYTFNMLNRSEVFRDNVFFFRDFMSHGTKSDGWTLEAGYPKNAPIDTYPRRSLSAGYHYRLAMALRAYQRDLDYICRGPVQGFKVTLHNPAETPKLGLHYFRAPHMQEVLVAVKPEMMTTSDGLKNYSPHRRQCYFAEDRYLAFYRIYTQQHCELECLANFTRIKCGCVAHQMPHEKGTPICGTGSTACRLSAQDELLRQELESTVDNEETNVNGNSICDCLPGCTSLVYNAETSQADFNWEMLASGLRLNTSELQGVRLTRLSIFFKEPEFIALERNELFGQTDFLSNCGGLLGLFTGFSFLSLIEILYFLSLRLMCNIKRYGRQYWSGSQALVNIHK